MKILQVEPIEVDSDSLLVAYLSMASTLANLNGKADVTLLKHLVKAMETIMDPDQLSYCRLMTIYLKAKISEPGVNKDLINTGFAGLANDMKNELGIDD